MNLTLSCTTSIYEWDLNLFISFISSVVFLLLFGNHLFFMQLIGFWISFFHLLQLAWIPSWISCTQVMLLGDADDVRHTVLRDSHLYNQYFWMGSKSLHFLHFYCRLLVSSRLLSVFQVNLVDFSGFLDQVLWFFPLACFYSIPNSKTTTHLHIFTQFDKLHMSHITNVCKIELEKWNLLLNFNTCRKVW